MKIKMKARTIKLIAVIVLSTLFAIVTNFIPNHNTFSYIWGMLFMGTVYIVFELMNNNI